MTFSRYPLEDCPTRITRPMKFRKLKRASPFKLKAGRITLAGIARIIGTVPANLRVQAVRFFGIENFTGGLLPEDAEKLIKHYKEGGYK